MKGGRCNAFVQRCKSEISDEVFNIVSKELKVNGYICDLLEKYFELLNKKEKTYAKEIDSKFEDFRVFNQKEKTDFINKKLNMLLFHKELSKLDFE